VNLNYFSLFYKFVERFIKIGGKKYQRNEK